VRVLFLTHRLPYAPNRGDRARAYHMVRLLAPFVELRVISLVHDDDEAAQTPQVRALGAAVSVFRVPQWKNRLRALPRLVGSTPLTHLLLDAPGIEPALERVAAEHQADVVLAYCSGMAKFAMAPFFRDVPLVLDMVDVDSAKWNALALTASWPMSAVYKREARTLRTFEAMAVQRARRTLVISERERAVLSAMSPGAPISVVENGVDFAGLKPSGAPASAAVVVFCGVMNYAPNVEGVLWFARDVWPLVLAAMPDARFSVVGADPVDEIRRLSAAHASITVTGTVADVRRHLWDSAVSVAPLLTSRGTQNKVLEAVAAGLPTVVTTPVSEGLPAAILCACRIADAPEDFARHVLHLLALPRDQRRLTAQQVDLEPLTWDRQLAAVPAILADAARSLRSEGSEARTAAQDLF
jgi:polysaccharide biosynthesis protein PslH